jgi:hypothetical protein
MEQTTHGVSVEECFTPNMQINETVFFLNLSSSVERFVLVS